MRPFSFSGKTRNRGKNMGALLGPPEIREPALTRPASVSGYDDGFMDAMLTKFNRETRNRVVPAPPMGRTPAGGATFKSSGNPCLDFFFNVVQDGSSSMLESGLDNAWDHDALMTLKLICNLRGVRGTGKSDKEGFYTAALWLHEHHPKTLACNLKSISNFGYFKDFPEILYRLLEGSEVREIQRAEWNRRKRGVIRVKDPSRKRNILFSRQNLEREKKRRRSASSAVLRELRIANAERRNKMEKERAKVARDKKRLSMAQKAIERYNHDPDFRFLYERVSDLFADRLRKDLVFLNAGDTRKVTLAAKWCPSLDSSFDRALLICESIARKLFPRESCPDYETIEEAHYAYRVRDRLRKEVLVPLRKVLELPEVYIGARNWRSIPYNRVSSVTMKFYKEKFLRHDPKRFIKYLNEVRARNAKIASRALLPHQILLAVEDDDGGQVAELQWKRRHPSDGSSRRRKFGNCLSMIDSSCSNEAAFALGLLVSQVSQEPWKGKFITFCEDPEFHSATGRDLWSKIEYIRRIKQGGKADIQKVFDLILKVAIDGKLKPEQMIKRLFVFSGMEFGSASGRPDETDYQAIVRKYREKGFGDAVPEIVFWKVRESEATPVPCTEKGVALMSGFSGNLLKIFLDWEGQMDPLRVMEAAISGDEYENLVVID